MAQKLWLEALGHTKSISIDQNMSVATVAGSDTDSYGFHLSCYFSRQFSWNLFQNNGEYASLIKSDSIADELLSLSLILGTDTITAKLVDALWRSPK